MNLQNRLNALVDLALLLEIREGHVGVSDKIIPLHLLGDQRANAAIPVEAHLPRPELLGVVEDLQLFPP